MTDMVILTAKSHAITPKYHNSKGTNFSLDTDEWCTQLNVIDKSIFFTPTSALKLRALTKPISLKAEHSRDVAIDWFNYLINDIFLPLFN